MRVITADFVFWGILAKPEPTGRRFRGPDFGGPRAGSGRQEKGDFFIDEPENEK